MKFANLINTWRSSPAYKMERRHHFRTLTGMQKGQLMKTQNGLVLGFLIVWNKILDFVTKIILLHIFKLYIYIYIFLYIYCFFKVDMRSLADTG